MTKGEQLAQELDRVFWENVDKRIGNQEQKPEVFYHYSALESLMGMMETNKIWMSKGTFLNDSNELLYILGIIESISAKVEQRIKKKYGNSEKTNKLTALFSREFDETMQKFEDEISLDDYEVYILSLTKNKDSLALWYNYAKGDGYNIGFSSEEMLKKINDFSDQVINQYKVVYGQVIYDRTKQEEIILSFFMDTVEHLYQKYNEIKFENMQKVITDHLFSIITTCSIFFKNEVFKSEEEYRIAFSKKINKDSDDQDIQVFFRSQNGIVIPFIMIDFDSMLPIRNITIGPKNNIDVAKAGMEQFLKSKGYVVEEIDIVKSIAELRY